MKRSGFKWKARKPLKRTRIRVKGDNSTALIKERIQETARLLVTYRDGGCVLRDIRHCGGSASVEDGEVISEPGVVIQADHLVTRANSASFADIRVIVCLCKNCHGWKHYHEKEYEALVKTVLSKETITLWDRVEADRQAHRTYKMDWNMQLCGLQMLLKDYEN